MFNKGIKIMDNSQLAKPAQYYSNSNEVIFRKIILDFEIEKRNLSKSITEKYFEYETMMRNRNNYKETWVIPLCFDKTKKLELDKRAKTYFSRKSNTNNFAKTASNGKHMKYI